MRYYYIIVNITITIIIIIIWLRFDPFYYGLLFFHCCKF